MDELTLLRGLTLAILLSGGCKKSEDPDLLGDDGDEDPDVEDDTEDTEDTDPPQAPDYREVGTHTVTVDDVTWPGVNDCEDQVAITRYTPSDPEGPVAVLMPSSFRKKEVMADIANHLATWGIEVWAAQPCFSDKDSGEDEQQNAEDIASIAHGQAPDRKFVFVGHGNSGVVAMLATVGSAEAVASFSYDVVNANDNDVGSVTLPAYGIMAPLHACNESHGALDLLDGGWQLGPSGSHCSFESPAEDGCAFTCDGQGQPPGMVKAIGALTVAYVLWQTDIDPLAEQYYTPTSAWADAMRSTSLVDDLP